MLPDGRHFSMRDYMAGIGIEPRPDGSMWIGREGIAAPFVWVLSDSLPKPEDFVLARSRTTLSDIYRAGEWEGLEPATPAPHLHGGPMPQTAESAAMPRNMSMAMVSVAESSVLLPERTIDRHQRKVAAARQRQAEKGRSRRLH